MKISSISIETSKTLLRRCLSAGLKKVNADDQGERGKLGLQKAKSAAEEGMSLIARRQKLLKLADRSEWGWAVVEEYVEDDLAEDSGDVKRIERAELAAGRKIARKRKAEGLGRGRGYGRGDSGALQPVGRRQLQQPLAPPVVRSHLTGAAVSTVSCFTCRYFQIISRNVLPHNYPNICSKNCDWFLRRLREVGIFENLVLDSLKRIKLQICLDHEALSALARKL